LTTEQGNGKSLPMPGLARLDAPRIFYHLMIPGIEGRKIFRDKKDREDFPDCLGRLLPETQTTCYGIFSINRGKMIPLYQGFFRLTKFIQNK